MSTIENDSINHPEHYNDFSVEAMAICNPFSGYLFNVFKYIIRAGKKISYTKEGNLENNYIKDLRKACTYLEYYVADVYSEVIPDELVKNDLKQLNKIKPFLYFSNNKILKDFSKVIKSKCTLIFLMEELEKLVIDAININKEESK